MDAITLGKGIIARGISIRGSNFDWAEQCERAQFYAGKVANGEAAFPDNGYGSAKIAYDSSKIASTSMADAPHGAVGFYRKSTNWHVVTCLGNGYALNTSPLMAGKGLVEFGKNLRITRLGDYYPDTWMGWSLRDGSRPRINVDDWLPAVQLPTPGIPSSGTDWATNPPSKAIQLRIQIALWKRGRYKGLRNGVFGSLSWAGIQTTIANVGYDGPKNGIPGGRTCYFIQVYAAKFGGYKGPHNSILGPNSWLGFTRGLEAGLR